MYKPKPNAALIKKRTDESRLMRGVKAHAEWVQTEEGRRALAISEWFQADCKAKLKEIEGK